ncbi:MAG: alpha-D-ribose 1-methylphosphonate 5-triphosphate synthase subunit PhnH [Candidatus Endobugula sp.]|jgi:alpha-D-ribose 1-methylphosphonate 5-triphosphate synthase subunit PhnH
MSTQNTVNDTLKDDETNNTKNNENNASSLDLLTAFTDKVGGSQWVYRQLLKAMSEPATILPLLPSAQSSSEQTASIATDITIDVTIDVTTGIPELYPDDWHHQQLYRTTWSVAQALLDSDCKVHLSSVLDQKSVTQSLRFYTDAQVTKQPSLAQFALMNLEEFANTTDFADKFSIGTLIAPHESCTLLIQVAHISNGASTENSTENRTENRTEDSNENNNASNESQLLLSGPGIKTQKNLAIEGLTQQQMAFLIDNNQQYPCGVDIIFCSPQHIAALPRSTEVQMSSTLTKVA